MRQFPNSHYIEFPGAGHGIINQGICALSMMKTFFDNPSNRPDDIVVKTSTGSIFAMPENNKGEP
jgi:hypothetical protein